MNATIAKIPLRRRIKKFLRNTGDRLCRHACCENCVLSWEERGPEDCDAGCLLYRDLYEGSPGCYLPVWVKKLVKARIEHKRDKAEAAMYEGMAEWYERSEKMDMAMATALAETFPELDLSAPDDRPFRLRSRYEDLLREQGLAEDDKNVEKR